MGEAKINKKELVHINDLIFKELIKRGYSLEGNTRIWDIADSKLWYLDSDQAQAFLDLEKSEEYQESVIQKEIDLINQNLKEIVKSLGDGPLNIIDLGCGDGKKAELFINKLGLKTKLRYCPVDISNYMVEKAIDRLSSSKNGDVDEVVKFQWNISDFENIENISTLLRKDKFKKNFILSLGNTLGNFEINELLYEIRSSMNDGDMLLIGNGLDNKNSKEILKSYDTPQVDNFLIRMLTKIGMKLDSLKFGARYKNSRIEIYYTLLDNLEISFLDKKVQFNKGDQIIVAVSYKYDSDEILSFLKMYFNEVNFFVSKDRSYCLALCKK